MKRNHVCLASLILIFTIFFCFPALAVTRKEALEYAKSKMDTVVGNGQCVAFAKDYYKSVFGESVRGNGSDYINNVPDGFTQMKYKSENWDPKPGDIVSWSWNKYGGNYGHVGIITKVDSKGFYYLDQNPYPVKESRFDYGQSGWTLAGVVRPPFEEEPAPEQSAPEADSSQPATATPNTISSAVEAIRKDVITAMHDGLEHANFDICETKSYAIVSSSSGKYMNINVNKISQIKNGSAINLYKSVGGDTNDTQRFVFTESAENTYLIKPQNSSYTVNVSSRKAGSKLLCWASNSKNNEEWIVEKVSGQNGCTFRLKNQPNMYLTQSGDTLKLQKKTGKSNQIFLIQ